MDTYARRQPRPLDGGGESSSKWETRTGGWHLWDHFLTASASLSVSPKPGPSHNLQTNQLEVTLPLLGIFHLCSNLLVLLTLCLTSSFSLWCLFLHNPWIDWLCKMRLQPYLKLPATRKWFLQLSVKTKFGSGDVGASFQSNCFMMIQNEPGYFGSGSGGNGHKDTMV